MKSRAHLLKLQYRRYNMQFRSTHWCDQFKERPEQQPSPCGPAYEAVIDIARRNRWRRRDEFDLDFHPHRTFYFSPLDFS